MAIFTSRYHDLGGGPVHVADFGGDGPPVVCVHGLGGSFANWAAVGRGLSTLGHVTALDLPGFGLTPPAGRSAKMKDNRLVLDAYLRSLEGPSLVVANSMGGVLAIRQASLAAETISGLVLVSPAIPSPPGVWPDPGVTALFSVYMVPGVVRAAMAARRALRSPEEVARWMLDLCAARFSRIAPEVLELHSEVARRRRHFPSVNRAAVEAGRSLLMSMVRPAEFDRVVASISSPTLVLSGREDRLIRYESALRLAALRPDWDVRILDDVGHIAMLEVPAAFVDLVTKWAAQKMAA